MFKKSNRLVSAFLAFFLCFGNLMTPVIAEGESDPEGTQEPVTETAPEEVPEGNDNPEITEEISEEPNQEFVVEGEMPTETENDGEELSETEETVDTTEDTEELEPEESEESEPAVLFSDSNFDITAEITPYHTYAEIKLAASTSYNSLYVVWSEGGTFNELTSFISSEDLNGMGLSSGYLNIYLRRNAETGIYEGTGNWAGESGLSPNTEYSFQILKSSQIQDSDQGTVWGYEPLSEKYSFRTANSIPETSADQFRYQKNGSYVTIEKYIGSGTEVTVPAQIEGAIVNNISSGAFKDNTSVKKVVLPTTVTMISVDLFNGCSNLETLVIPGSITGVSYGAITGCEKLKTVGPEGSNANIQISINDHIFDGRYSVLFLYAEELTIPDDVTDVGTKGIIFNGYGKNLRKINIGEGVKTIGNNSFYGLTNLQEVHFGSSLVSIGDYAFQGTGLSGSIEFPASLQSIGNQAFRNTSITEMHFSGNAPTVPVGYDESGNVSDTAFADASKVKLYYDASASGWKSGVWNGYFTKASSDTTEYVDEGVAGSDIIWRLQGTGNDLTLNFIGNGAMFDYDSTWDGSSYRVNAGWGTYSPRITTLTVSEGITTIGKNALYNTDSLVNVMIPNTVLNFGDYAFYDCDGLKKLPLPAALETIGSNTFAKCDNIIGRVSFPDTLVSIGDYAFNECTGLSGYLEFPESVTKIGANAFSSCTGFKGKLVLPSNIEVISDYAFSNCAFTGSLTIPSQVKKIGQGSFMNCYGFSGDLVIPDSVEEIGAYAFNSLQGMSGCLSLPAALTVIGEGAFRYHHFSGDLIIPSGVREIPEGAFASVWGDTRGFDGTLVLPEELTTIGNDAFRENSFSCELNIPNTVSRIGNNAFRNTTFTGGLVLPSSLEIIGDYAFENTQFEDHTVIPDHVVSIGMGTFRNIPKLVHFTFAGEDPTVVAADNANPSFDEKDILLYDPNIGGNYTTPEWNGYSAYPADTVTPEGVKITSSEYILQNGKSILMTASKMPSDSIGDIKWSIADSNSRINGVPISSYFSIDQRGFLTTTWEGNYSIEATVQATTTIGGYTDTMKVYAVNGDIVRVTGLKMQKTQYRMIPNSSYELKAVFTPERPSITGAEWTSSDPSVVSVAEYARTSSNYDGKKYITVSTNSITAHKPGTATITAVSSDGKYETTCVVTVLNQSSSIILDYGELTVNQGDTVKISGYVVGEEEEDSSLNWYSTDNKVAVIDNDGNITAMGPGTATITARSSDGGSADCIVTVLAPIQSIELDMTSLILSEGDTAKINAIITPYNTTDPDVVWSTSDAGIVTVEQGFVTAVLPGTATVTAISADGRVSAECAVTVKESDVPEEDIPEEGIPSGIWVAGIEDKTYTGAAQKQDIRVFNGNILLTVNKDYKVSYKNNKNAGTASVIIAMKGNYSGTVVRTFEIAPLPLTEKDYISADDLYTVYSDTLQNKVPVVTFGKVKLKKDRDFTVLYGEADDLPGAGYRDITIQGIGNYTDEIVVKEYFSDPSSSMISKASINKIGAQLYTGSEIEPAVTVKYNKATLTEGVDYEISYENNISVGTATIIITGLGEYTGIKKTTFKISGIPMKKVKVNGLFTTAEYTGEEITQKDAELVYGDSPLTEGVDYQVSYSKNLNAGTAKVTFTGMGGYTGSITKSFKITKTSIEEAEVEDHDNIRVEYSKGGATPKPVVYWNDTELKENTDYTLKYSNNKAVVSKKTPQITITGIGNFSGKIVIPFEITQKDLSQTTMVVKDKIYSAKPNAFKASVTVVDTDGKKLKSGTDYLTPVYSWKSTQAPSAGTTVFVSVTGKGNYTGSTAAQYRIIMPEQNISKAKVTVKAQEYTGRSITLNPDVSEPATGDLVIVMNGNNLTYGKDYEIVGYSKNINKGTATVTIRGIGSYGGEKTVKFSIIQKKCS